MNKAKQQGFTLIELIVVIVILGILAVTAAPKFINFTDDANLAAIKGVKGGIASAMLITNAKAAIDGKEKDNTGAYKVNDAVMAFGYPTATFAGIVGAANLSASKKQGKDYVYVEVAATATDPKKIFLSPNGKMANDTTDAVIGDITGATGSLCYIEYTEGEDGVAAIVDIVDTNCGA